MTRDRYQRRERRRTRQAYAAVAVVVLAAGVPIVVGLGLVAVTAWLITFKMIGLIHIGDIHATIYGWLTDWTYKDGHRQATPNAVPLVWFVGWINVYLVYQLAELASMLVGGFARMARREPKEKRWAAS